VGREVVVEQPDHPKAGDDPAVAGILAHPRAQISAGEQRRDRKRAARDRKRDQRRMRKKPANPPQPRIARPKYAAVPPWMSVAPMVGIAATLSTHRI
jgi:hypothetical protein